MEQLAKALMIDASERSGGPYWNIIHYFVAVSQPRWGDWVDSILVSVHTRSQQRQKGGKYLLTRVARGKYAVLGETYKLDPGI